MESYQCMKGKKRAYFQKKVYSFPGPEKQAHSRNLREETETHKSCGERPHVDGRSEKGRVAHLVRH